jgi:hypothetical protein
MIDHSDKARLVRECVMADRTEILDRLFVDAKTIMAKLIAKNGTFSNLEILRRITRQQQQAYIDLLWSFRDTENRSPFNATHQVIGLQILNIALEDDIYERDTSSDRMGRDLFGNKTAEKFFIPKQK